MSWSDIQRAAEPDRARGPATPEPNMRGRPGLPSRASPPVPVPRSVHSGPGPQMGQTVRPKSRYSPNCVTHTPDATRTDTRRFSSTLIQCREGFQNRIKGTHVTRPLPSSPRIVRSRNDACEVLVVDDD